MIENFQRVLIQSFVKPINSEVYFSDLSNNLLEVEKIDSIFVFNIQTLNYMNINSEQKIMAGNLRLKTRKKKKEQQNNECKQVSKVHIDIN